MIREPHTRSVSGSAAQRLIREQLRPVYPPADYATLRRLNLQRAAAWFARRVAQPA